MILQLLQFLLISLFPKKNEPVRLQKKQSVEIPLNWTFIIIALALAIFFVILLVSALNGVKMVESGMVYNGGLY